MTSRTTIAFVHGAFADSSGWSETISALDAAGVPVIAIPNQLRGLAADADYVRSVVATIDGPVILVGHSYGGAVIGEAARGADNVAAFVFVAAYILDEGESIATVLDPAQFPGGRLGADTLIERPFSNPGLPGGVDTDLYIAVPHFAEVFAADLPDDRSRLMAFMQRPLSVSALTGVAGARPVWHDKPCWALVAEQDNAIPPAGQHWMANRAGAVLGTIASSHAVMVSQPAAVTKTIIEAIESI
ncbi:pimeloyl-ACP methyl ester carboxylesterase [Kribbella sp. VKM Ac-2571]|uniref:alpha/beta fold hydrolase n=1 Tax=Kribbella sp. VKM Ac-2571 TaxID=2512222 RepID=UPI00105D9D85|nr:alpha/beta hydrolase [Kribbella sp. VKM Ac-2571]TDO66518.1 pimeloyl-ACP methyl ester carboxylesterase [Kribbella sp. VKM Ac-2571]